MRRRWQSARSPIPMIRANALMPAARFGMREEMKQAYGFGWREHVRGVTTTLDAVENLAFHERIKANWPSSTPSIGRKINPGFTLDPAKVAANASADARRHRRRRQRRGRDRALFRDRREGLLLRLAGRRAARVRPLRRRTRRAHDRLHGQDPGRHRHRQRAAATGPTRTTSIAARRRAAGSKAATRAAARRRGRARDRRLRLLAQPADRVARRTARPGAHAPTDRSASASTCRRRESAEEATPPSTAAVRGLIAGSPRRVHQMAGVVLASLTEQGHKPVRPPTLVRAYDFASREPPAAPARRDRQHHAEPADRRRRPADAQDAAAGADVLRQRRRAARHVEEP